MFPTAASARSEVREAAQVGKDQDAIRELFRI
jgi:hypothetical protein